MKGQWSPAEDSVLKEKVAQLGERQWNKIAESIDGKVGKQCRERWFNHVSPDIKWGPWSEEEDAMLIEAHQEVGNKWSKIAKRLSGRTENSTKNRWNSVMRRKNTNTSDGSQLKAYIEGITDVQKEDEEAAEMVNNDEVKESALELDGDHNHDICDLIRMVYPSIDFTNKDWADELLNSPMDDDLNPLGFN